MILDSCPRPAPGDEFDGGLVIASEQIGMACLATLLILTGEIGGHYRVCETQHNVVTKRTAFAHIVPATAEYREAIGGY